MARADLLELSAEALTALSNPGFVKRAQKDAAEGKLPQIEEQGDGAVTARYSDGTLTTLAPGAALRDAICSCPATGLCRHRVALVLAYQAQAGQAPAGDAAAVQPLAWCPSQLSAAADALPRSTLEQARRLAAARPVIKLMMGATPTARLPMCDVRFLSRTSLGMARCDCQQGGNCAHVAVAVWAFAQARRSQGAFEAVTLELDAPAAAGKTVAPPPAPDRGSDDAQALVDALADRLWLDGTAQNPVVLEAPFEQALQSARQLGWNWVAEGLEQLRQAIAAQNARASGADPATLLHLVSSLSLRLAAARAAAAPGAAPALPARQILGVGVKGEVALDHLRLVPLGAASSCDDDGDGVRLIWADPDTLAVTVLEKRWPRSTGDTALRERRLLGMPLHRLAASQLVTKAAKRRANGLITIGSAASHTSALPLAGTAWDSLGSPLRQPDLPSLRAYLRNLPPDFVRPLQAIEHVHVLPLGEVLGVLWDAASQTLSAYVVVGAASGDNADEHTLLLSLAHDKAAPSAVDALAAALAGEHGVPLAVAGSVGRLGGQRCMTPLAILTESGLVVPQLAAPVPARAMAPASPRSPDPLNAMLERVTDMLAQCLRQGLRHQGSAAIERAAGHARALRAAGLVRCADALSGAFEQIRGGQAAALAQQLAALHALLQMLAGDPLPGLMDAAGS